MVGPPGFRVFLFSVEGEVFDVHGWVVVGVFFLFCPFSHVALFPFPLILGLWGRLVGGIGAQVVGRGWGLPSCLVVFLILLLV